jgi:(1->4)-alpha-D-glucan 1-alpha-D-glucosylmutase
VPNFYSSSLFADAKKTQTMKGQSSQPRKGRVPVSTYRLQLNRSFTLEAATSLVEYLDQLGISDCYLSPILKARAGSLHGYDITDYAGINPELGTERDLEQLAVELKRRGMGILLERYPGERPRFTICALL